MTERQLKFVELIQSHRHQVMGYIFALVHNLHDTEDLYQQTIAILWRKFDQYDPERPFGAWACAIARYEVANFGRSHQQRTINFAEDLSEQLIDPASENPAEGLEAYGEYLQRCVAKLGRPDQLLLELYYGGLKSGQQIAEEQGRSLQGIYNALSRIRRRVLACIEHSVAQEHHG